MSDLFLYGSLLHEPLLQLVLGPDSRARSQPAQLADHAVFWAQGGGFPLIQPSPGGSAGGILLSGLSATDLARLDFYEGGFAYDRRPVQVDTQAGPAPATVYFPQAGKWQAGAPWALSDWQARFGAMAMRAATEVMDSFGHRSPDTMARLRPQIEVRAASWVRAQAERTPRAIRSPLSSDDVAVRASRRPYQDYFAMVEQDVSFARFDGTASDTVQRAAFVSGDAVTVLPYDPTRDRVMVIEQFRFGPFVRGDRSPWSLEPIAGRIDPGETPEDCARRESLEEAGLQLRALEHMNNYYTSPGAVSEYLFSYLALADLPDAVAGLGGVESEAEDIRAVLIGFDALMQMLRSGEAQNAPMVISALWLAANRDRLRAGA